MPSGPSGAAIITALDQAGVRFVAAVPDIVTSEGLLWPLSRDSRFRLIRLCKEDEGISICTGLAFAGHRAVLLMQQTGLLDSINSICAIAVKYRQPVCMIVGLQGKEADQQADRSAHHAVRIVGPILDAMGVERISIEDTGDVAALASAIDAAYTQERPMVALIGREVTA